jgi:hypothetical protein
MKVEDPLNPQTWSTTADGGQPLTRADVRNEDCDLISFAPIGVGRWIVGVYNQVGHAVIRINQAELDELVSKIGRLLPAE